MPLAHSLLVTELVFTPKRADCRLTWPLTATPRMAQVCPGPVCPAVLSLVLLQGLERGLCRVEHSCSVQATLLQRELACPAPREAKGALTVGDSVLSWCPQAGGTVARKETLLGGELLER